MSRLEGRNRQWTTKDLPQTRASSWCSLQTTEGRQAVGVNSWEEAWCINVGLCQNIHLLALYPTSEGSKRVCEGGHKDLKDVSTPRYEPSRQLPRSSDFLFHPIVLLVPPHVFAQRQVYKG